MAKSRVRTSLQLFSEMGGESVPSHSPQIFSPRREGLYGFIFSFPSWQVNLSKGISEGAELCPCRAQEPLRWEQLRGGFALWDRADTQKVKGAFQASPPRAASLGAAAREGIPWLP